MRLNRPSALQRQALAAAFAVFATMIVAHFFSMQHSVWEVMTAICILHTSHVRQLKKSMQIFIAVLLGAIGVSVLLWCQISQLGLASIVMSVACIFFLAMRFTHFSETTLARSIFIAIQIMLCAPLLVVGQNYAIFHDIGLGAIVGGVVGFVFFPERVDEDYRLGITPLLQLYSSYVAALTFLLFQKERENAKAKAESLRLAIESYLGSHSAFPDWVYEPGFSPHFQEGQRYFLLKIEQIGQILFALHHTVQSGVVLNELQSLELDIHRVLSNVELTLLDLKRLLELEIVSRTLDQDLEHLHVLEQRFKERCVMPIGLFESSPDRLQGMSLLYQLRDLYNTLADLREAIR